MLLEDFDTKQARIFEHGKGEPEGFGAADKIQTLRELSASLFEEDASEKTLKEAIKKVTSIWHQFSEAFKKQKKELLTNYQLTTSTPSYVFTSFSLAQKSKQADQQNLSQKLGLNYQATYFDFDKEY